MYRSGVADEGDWKQIAQNRGSTCTAGKRRNLVRALEYIRWYLI
jgi:hypothetical protein